MRIAQAPGLGRPAAPPPGAFFRLSSPTTFKPTGLHLSQSAAHGFYGLHPPCIGSRSVEQNRFQFIQQSPRLSKNPTDIARPSTPPSLSTSPRSSHPPPFHWTTLIRKSFSTFVEKSTPLQPRIRNHLLVTASWPHQPLAPLGKNP